MWAEGMLQFWEGLSYASLGFSLIKPGMDPKDLMTYAVLFRHCPMMVSHDLRQVMEEEEYGEKEERGESHGKPEKKTLLSTF